jgi:hypothetical protein
MGQGPSGQAHLVGSRPPPGRDRLEGEAQSPMKIETFLRLSTVFGFVVVLALVVAGFLL